MTTYQAKIDFIPGISVPDEYNPQNGRIPSDDFVVTRNVDGSPLSRYGDLTWDRTPYAVNCHAKVLNFQFWNDDEAPTEQRLRLVDEVRWLMFVLMWLRPGNSLSDQTLQGYLKYLRAAARYCEEEGQRIQDVLTNPEHFGELLQIGGFAKSFRALLQTLRSLGPDAVGFEVANKNSLAALAKIAAQYRESAKQTPPIPTRIYSQVLVALSQEIQEWERVIDRVLALLNLFAKDPLTGLHPKNQRIRGKALGRESDERRPDFPELLRQLDLVEFWTMKKYPLERAGIVSALMEAQLVASLQIQAFTGMRQNEVFSLPHFCLEESNRDGNIHYIVKGQVTKLTQGKIKRTQWVTSDSGRVAILLAQRISRAIYQGRRNKLSEDPRRLNERHLLINPNYLLEGKANLPTRAPLTEAHRFGKLKARLEPVIELEDIKELMRIDPHRPWTSEEDFQVGRPWNLTTHQFRRSLALYAQRSGLVSLPTLKRQLQHITQEMTLYYARGSAFARDFIGTGHKEPHFGTEWQETQPVSQYLAYANHVLFSEEPELLYGGHVQFVNLRLRDKDGNVLPDRDATLKRFKKGEIAWKPTPVGGCVNTAPCDKSPIDLLEVNCIANNCKNMVGNLKKTERVIQIKTAQVEAMRKIDPVSPEFHQEESELRMLTQGYERAKSWLAKSKEAA